MIIVIAWPILDGFSHTSGEVTPLQNNIVQLVDTDSGGSTFHILIGSDLSKSTECHTSLHSCHYSPTSVQYDI